MKSKSKIKLINKYLNKKYLVYGVFIVLGFLVTIVISQGLYTKNDPREAKLNREHSNTLNNIVNEVTELHPVKVLGIIVPHTEEEIVQAVKNNEHVSIGGGRNSMGGQTASSKAVQIDMREYNKIIRFSTTSQEITVQTGIRWRDIQDYIDPYNLSVKIMQTYSNFTVGGSLSVNVHGRYVGLGPIILSVKSIRVVLASGEVVNASPNENSDIFYSAIGGYGGIGVITEATLELAPNVNVKRNRVKMPISSYAEYFKNVVKASTSKTLFHNGDIYPMDFDSVSAVSWDITDDAQTTDSRLIPRDQDYWLERFVWVTMSEWPLGKQIREYLIEPLLYSGKQPVHTRNYEASYDIMELEPASRASSTYVLQEYFVPVENFDAWIPKMKKVFNDNDVNVLNVSIRHALPDPGSKLAWAKKESFAFVVYYKQGTNEASKLKVEKWTKEMINEVLKVDGGYYLPYQPHATDEQFYKAYPKALEYFEIKNKYDPTNKFTNSLWDKYFSKDKLNALEQKQKIKEDIEYASIGVKDYNRPSDNMYLSMPEWYIVYSASEYADTLKHKMPSDFNYSAAIKTYWDDYDKVLSLTASSSNSNSDYITVLKVIGVSFTAENIIKCFYENTLGRVSEFLAGNKKVPEDYLAQKAAKDYADFIYDYPWYDFPYSKYLREVWNESYQYPKSDLSFGQNIRRVERKIFLTLEFGIKTIYSKVIAYLTHSKFGVQDDIISAVVIKKSNTFSSLPTLISAPHYQPFTRKLLEEFGYAYENNIEYNVLDIAGNKIITLSFLSGANLDLPEYAKIVTSYSENADQGGVLIPRIRNNVEISVEDLFNFYKYLKSEGIKIDHVYDY